MVNGALCPHPSIEKPALMSLPPHINPKRVSVFLHR